MTTSLPILDLERDISNRLKCPSPARLVLSAPTGSGKSTQVPQMLLRNGLSGDGQIIILQPRRIAARLLAARVASEMGVPLGREVGYQVRLEDVSGPGTRIKFETEGILLRRMQRDPTLEGVSTIIFDEFHERHLYGDVTLARALDLQESARPDLSLLVMSATLETERLGKYLDPCETLTSDGRVHPVEIEYLPASRREPPPPWESAAAAFGRWVASGGEGDVLVFMPGAFEIARTLEAIRERPEAKGFTLLPLHGELSPRDQDAAVARHDRRKVVVATNVAETSITIDGIRLVIDSGLARIPRYDPNRGINTLLVEKISRAAADQRTGRAGRTAPGTCVRLWTETEQRQRHAREQPEVKRLDLCEVALTLKAAGVRDLRGFRWLEPPDDRALAHAEELLADLGAVAGDGGVTDLGRRMLAFPVHPRYARMLLAAQELGCVREAALAAALTQGRDLLLRKVDRQTARFREERLGGRVDSDFEMLVRAWRFAAKNGFRLDACRRAGIHAQASRQVGPVFDQFLAIAKREGLDIPERETGPEPVGGCVLIGFSDGGAGGLDRGTLRCAMFLGRRGVLARESACRRAPLLVAAEVSEIGGKEIKTLLGLASAVEPEWLKEYFPDDVTTRRHVAFDAGPRRVIAEEQTLFRDLVLESRPLDAPPAEEAARLLAEEIAAGRLRLAAWNDEVERWILRLNRLAGWCPDLELPPIDDEARRELLGQLCHGATSYKEVRERPVLPTVKGWLNGSQQNLVERHAPDRVTLSTGRKVKVHYVADAAPYIQVRIADLFDARAIPKIAMGRVTPLLHVLAPNMRPVQVTDDLAGFWRDHYPRVKRELQRRYPKHEWRELS